jgi:hypothetical protein
MCGEAATASGQKYVPPPGIIRAFAGIAITTMPRSTFARYDF